MEVETGNLLMARLSAMVRDGQKAGALALLPELVSELGSINDVYPPCVKCQGFAEVLHPTEAGKKVSCAERTDLCAGNQYGRMTMDQFVAYIETESQPPAIVESVPGAAIADDVKPTPPGVAGGGSVQSLSPAEEAEAIADWKRRMGRT